MECQEQGQAWREALCLEISRSSCALRGQHIQVYSSSGIYKQVPLTDAWSRPATVCLRFGGAYVGVV